jgi:CheY-like chemotaxis protein
MVDTHLTSERTLAVAETDAVVRDSVIRALKDDFKVVITASAGVGKTALLRRSVQLVIYDLKLGIRDLKSLRERYPEMPIMVITPKEPTAILNQALALGKTDFITKPVDSYELKLRVNQCLRKWHFYESHLTRQPEEIKTSAPDFIVAPKLSGSIAVPMPELHSPSGRLNAASIAKYLDVPLSEVAVALHINYTALHKTPDSQAAQPALTLFKRILVILTDMLGAQETVRAWLNSPHPDLGDRTPISVMLEGHADAVLTILENALVGVQS